MQNAKKLILLAVMFSAVAIGLCLAKPLRRTVRQRAIKALQLLNKYTQALDSTKSFIEHYEQSTEFSYQVAGTQDEGKNFKRGQVRHDDQRIYFQQYTWGDYNIENKDMPEDKPHYNCNIVDGKKKMVYQNIRWINMPDSSGSAYRQPDQRTEYSLSGHFGISYIVGYIGSHERLDAILRKAARISVRERTENVRGSECFVIDADTKCGRYSVWLDPEHGFHPAKVRRRAKGGDYTRSHLMSKGETALTYLDTVRFEKVDGLWVPMEADSGCDKVTPQGYFVKEDYHYKRTQIILNPDHDKLGSFADPILEDPNNDPELVNGTRVEMMVDGRRIEYTWQDGKLVDANGREVNLEKLNKKAAKTKNAKPK